MSQFVVTASALNLRDAPSTDGNVIAILERGDVVESIEPSTDSHWQKISHGANTGWASSKYLQPAMAEAPVAAFPWFGIAMKELGTSETAGSGDNPRIVEYLCSTTLGGVMASNDETPWCSAFVNFCVEQAGFAGTDSASARSWLNWGRKTDVPVTGCIAVFKRGDPPSGHVAFYVSESGGNIKVLGGNQGNKVSIQEYNRDRLLGFRVPTTLKIEPPYAVVRVFYATDRSRVQSTKPAEFFGTERGELSYGMCEVSIPRDHRMGELESPSIWRLQFREDPEKHVVLLSVTLTEKSQYFAELATRILASSGKNAFIFVHGYNVSFEGAARRTAQISYDLGFDGAPVFYSWPSQGTFTGYPTDETNIEWTQANLRRFLDDIVALTEADNIYLIAHSMGSRALTRVFSSLISDNPTLRQRFHEVILTAPDIDADIFKRDIAPQIVGSHPSVTLYASSEDIAVLASKKFHGYPRAGDAGDGLVLVPGIDTIDATGIDTSFLKHSYFAEARSVLADIFSLVRDGKRPDHRFGLEPVDTAAGRYWKFKR